NGTKAAGAGGATTSHPAAQGGTTPAAAGTTTTAANSTTFGLITGYGGLCVDDAGNRVVSGNAVDVATCNGTSPQDWPVSASGSSHPIQVHGLCIGLESASTTAATPLVTYACDGSASEQFVPESNGELYNPLSGMCVIDPNASTTTNTAIEIAP